MEFKIIAGCLVKGVIVAELVYCEWAILDEVLGLGTCLGDEYKDLERPKIMESDWIYFLNDWIFPAL